MRCFEESIAIAAPRGTVWRLMAEVVEWPRWLPTMTSVEALDAPALRVGARYRIAQPRLPPAVWTVVAFEPPGRFAWESRSPGVRALADHIIEEPAPGRSRVTLRITLTGLLAAPVGLLAGAITRRYMALEAESLRHLAETAHAGGAD